MQRREQRLLDLCICQSITIEIHIRFELDSSLDLHLPLIVSGKARLVEHVKDALGRPTGLKQFGILAVVGEPVAAFRGTSKWRPQAAAHAGRYSCL